MFVWVSGGKQPPRLRPRLRYCDIICICVRCADTSHGAPKCGDGLNLGTYVCKLANWGGGMAMSGCEDFRG